MPHASGHVPHDAHADRRAERPDAHNPAMKAFSSGFMGCFGVAVAVVVALIAFEVLSNPAVQRALSSQAGTTVAVSVPTSPPSAAQISVSTCSWPTLGGTPAGRAFLTTVTARGHLPVNPLYFSVTSSTSRVYRATVMPFALADYYRSQSSQGEMQVVDLGAGQAADGWLYFNPPDGTTLVTLVYDNGLGDHDEVALENCGSPTKQ